MPSPVQTLTAFLTSLSALGTFIGVSLIIPGPAGFLSAADRCAPPLPARLWS